MIINGSASWDSHVVENLEKSFLDGQKVDFFIGSPKSLYDCAHESAENNPDKIFLIDKTDASYTFLLYDRNSNEQEDYERRTKCRFGLD